MSTSTSKPAVAALSPELTLSYHLKLEQPLRGPGNKKDEARAIERAQYYHALAVSDELLRFINSLASATETLSSKDATYYLKFGALRRIVIVSSAFRRLIGTIPPERRDPLNQDEINQATLDVNAIYLNIQGTLDNFAWGLLFEHNETLAKTVEKSPKRRSSVGIFKKVVTDISPPRPRRPLDGMMHGELT
jgi:hypothetical protein